MSYNRLKPSSGLYTRPQTLRSQGFTLVELVAVLVILGITAALGSGFVVSTFESYDQVQKRSKLIAKGRLAIEQMTRQIRVALPNSVRVSAGGNCIEFMPLIGGANYEGLLPDASNVGSVATVNQFDALPYTLGTGSAAHVIVGRLGRMKSTVTRFRQAVLMPEIFLRFLRHFPLFL